MVDLLTYSRFSEMLKQHDGDYKDFMKKIGKQYVEVQVWADEYFLN